MNFVFLGKGISANGLKKQMKGFSRQVKSLTGFICSLSRTIFNFHRLILPVRR